MRINILLFWFCSLGISWLGCYLYQLTAFEIFSDSDYLQSLELSPYADTGMVAMADAYVLSIRVGVLLLVALIIFLVASWFKRTEIIVQLRDFVPTYQRGNFPGLIVPLLAYVSTFYWMWNLLETLRIKFFGLMLVFTLVVVLITWTYAVWLLRLFE